MRYAIKALTVFIFILTSVVPSVNRIDIRALTLVGPPGASPILDRLAVLHLHNRPYIEGMRMIVVTILYFDVRQRKTSFNYFLEENTIRLFLQQCYFVISKMLNKCIIQ